MHRTQINPKEVYANACTFDGRLFAASVALASIHDIRLRVCVFAVVHCHIVMSRRLANGSSRQRGTSHLVMTGPSQYVTRAQLSLLD